MNGYTHPRTLANVVSLALISLLGLAAFALLSAPAAAATTSTIRGGFSAAAGLSAAGPYAGVLVYDVTDPAPPPAPPRAKAKKGQPKTKAASRPPAPDPLNVYSELGGPRRLVLAERENGTWRRREIAAAERIGGPVCPKETTPTPVVAWTELSLGEWRLCFWRDGAKHTVAFSNLILRNPLIAQTPGGLVIGCESDTSRASFINLYDERGTLLLRTQGRRGRLAATREGLLLLAERTGANAIWLEATAIADGKPQHPVKIQGPRDYTFNADLAVDPAGGAAWIAAECAVAFGDHCQLGLDREIRVWRLAPGSAAAEPFPDAAHAALPVPPRAFKTGMGPSTENTPPIRPIVLARDGKPAVAFRQFRCRTNKDFGWDVFWCRPDGPGWCAPARLTEQLGSPDTGYAILADGAGWLGVFPELDNPGRSSASYAPRVAFVPLAPDRALPPAPIPEAQRGAAWRTPERFVNIAPEPPALPGAPAGLTLLWGDLHAHTLYSKCVPSANGTPDEMIRYLRDVLGLSVIGLLEHTQVMGLAECLWTCDAMEAEAGYGRILLYGTEPALSPGRHTNLYATTRSDFDRLCSLFRRKGNPRAAGYADMVQTFPAAQAVALRHFHGDTATDDRLSSQSFEPRLEVAMEAMQGRGNNLLGEGSKAGFPSVYLNQGFKIGLVGGSDHFRETEALNRYCLTGFWVRERTAQGVWEALRNRRTLATSNAKIAIWATLNGCAMGDTVAASGPLRFKVALAAARPVRRVTLIRDGEVLPWTPVGAKTATLELEDKTAAPGRHWYVVTAEADSAYPQPAIGHASPIFVEVR